MQLQLLSCWLELRSAEGGDSQYCLMQECAYFSISQGQFGDTWTIIYSKQVRAHELPQKIQLCMEIQNYKTYVHRAKEELNIIPYLLVPKNTCF